MAEISESTLRRLFKEQAGKTLYEFIRETKMTHAARKLLVTNEPISAIAYELGYEAPSYFYQMFLRKCSVLTTAGVPPDFPGESMT